MCTVTFTRITAAGIMAIGMPGTGPGDWPPGLLVLTAVRFEGHPHWTFRSIAMGRKCSKDTAMQPKSNARHTYAIFNQDTISSSARGETSATFLRRCKCLFMQSRFSLNAFKVAKILL